MLKKVKLGVPSGTIVVGDVVQLEQGDMEVIAIDWDTYDTGEPFITFTCLMPGKVEKTEENTFCFRWFPRKYLNIVRSIDAEKS